MRSGRSRAVLVTAGLCIAVLGLFVTGLGAEIARALGIGEAHTDSALAESSAQPPTAGDEFTPELGLPATDVVAIGAAPQESPGEVWAYGAIGDAPVDVNGRAYSDQYVLLEHTSSTSGWQVVPLPAGPEDKPLASNFGGASKPSGYGAFAGQTTVTGGVVLLSGQSVVVRDPGGEPRLAPTLESAPAGVLASGESLLPPSPSGGVTLPYAAIEDIGGHAGAHTGMLIAPFNDGDESGSPHVRPGVLHYDGTAWSREPIALTSGQESGFVALALACGGTTAAPASSSPQNCWLLADYHVGAGAGAPNRLALFRRVASSSEPSGYAWEPQPVAGGMLGEQAQIAVAPLAQGAQMLTVTAQGAWVDLQAKIVPPSPGHGQEFSDVSELAIPTGASEAAVLGPWCYPTGPGCERTLGAPLPAQYRSFAAPGASTTDPGRRVITGLADRAMLELSGGGFSYVVGAGGDPGVAPGGATFDPPREGAPWEGWIADGAGPESAADGEGQSQAIAVAPSGTEDDLKEESVPFRRPLLALAQAPGSTPGDPSAAAITVGAEGQIAHFTPGQGWRPEALYDASGRAQRPNLRGVAWPEVGRAYAVGDEGAMWLWRADTGLWEQDPAKPLNFIGNLTGIAFAPGDPQTGYAVGKQGVLLKYGKSWEQVPLPGELQGANFTSIAFAGSEALATYRTIRPVPGSPNQFTETGGVAVEEDGSGLHWHIDPGAASLLARLPVPQDTVLTKVAGLPDGGAVAAGPGEAIERDSPSSGWRFSAQPLPEAQNVSALAAYRDAAGAVRAVVSLDLDERLGPKFFAGVNLEQGAFKGDLPLPVGRNQPPSFIEPDPLPNSGYLLRETASGWSDMEHEALPAPGGSLPKDMPIRPDPVLALLVSPAGDTGVAVGGQTGDLEGRGLSPQLHSNNTHYQTAAAMRFPASAASSDGTSSPVPIVSPAGAASFVVGGQAACAQAACADFAEEGLGPDAWLAHAIQTANGIAAASGGGLHAFLYTGGRLPVRTGGEGFSRELARYATLLGGNGSLPVYAADSSDVGQFAPGGNGSANYSFLSTGVGGSVDVIVLDFSSGELGAGQRAWLEQQLAEASARATPAIVMGNAALGFALPVPSSSGEKTVTEARDALLVAQILVRGGASAYFFDYPGSNVRAAVNFSGRSIPAFGTGTLGYVDPPNERFEAGALGSSGFLLASVDVAERKPDNRAPVSAEVIPNIGQLALDATDGALLRRSHVGLFDALARRPPAGVAVESGNGIELAGPDPYDQIPFDCQGANCAYEVHTQYTFTSSNPDIANFVAHEPASNNPRQVELGANQLPIPDSHSGLLCAYNEGTTIVSITTGGLTYSEPVTVQGGAVEYPCGTVPLKNPPRSAVQAAGFAALGAAPASQPPPAGGPQAVSFPPAPAPAPGSQPHPVVVHPPVLFVPLIQPVAGARPVIVPPPGPPVARPAPPSGTAEVSQTVGASEREREKEEATDMASNNFSAYHSSEHPWPGPWLAFPLLVIVAGAGLSIGRSGPRRRSARRRRHAFARASVRRSRQPARWG